MICKSGAGAKANFNVHLIYLFLMPFAWARSSVCINETTILFLFSRTKYEKSDDDASIAGSNHEHQVLQNSASCFEDNVENNLSGKPGSDVSGRNDDGMAVLGHQRRGKFIRQYHFSRWLCSPKQRRGV